MKSLIELKVKIPNNITESTRNYVSNFHMTYAQVSFKRFLNCGL